MSVSLSSGVFDPIGSIAAGGILTGYNINDVRTTAIQNGQANAGMMRSACAIGTAGVLQFEVDIAWVTISNSYLIGIQLVSTSSGNNPQNNLNGGWAWNGVGQRWGNSSGVAYGTSWGANASLTVGVVVDFTAGSITFYKSGVSQGVAFTGLALTAGVLPGVSPGNTANATTSIIRTSNFNYPVAGASPWDASTRIVTLWHNIAASVQGSFDSIGYGPANPNFVAPITPSVPGGPLQPLMLDVPTFQAYGNYLTDNTVPIPTFGDINGLVTVGGLPAKRLVRIYRDIDGACFGEKWSDPITGAVTFYGMSKAWTYTGLAYDYTGTYQSLVWDRVRPQ
jgi:hypothetical protein